jgi:hypothetical protein
VLRSNLMVSHNIRKGNLKLTLSVNKEILENFKKFCEEKGYILSKQIENFMKEKLKKWQKLNG